MNSKERVKLAFSHREADRVPVGELYINSPVASEILGRTAYTGWGGHVRCGIMNKMLMEGRGEEFFHQEVVDLVELYRKLELDMIMIERPPLARPIIPSLIDEATYRFDDPQTGCGVSFTTTNKQTLSILLIQIFVMEELKNLQDMLTYLSRTI